MASATERVSTAEIKCRAKELAMQFLKDASCTRDPKAATDWSLAAKNSIQVALTCEQITATQTKARRSV